MQRYTTSSLGTLFRGAARALRSVRPKPIPWATHAAHWRRAVRTVLNPHATQRLQPAPAYARINHYPAFRNGSARPRIPRIPPGHAVGLGTARNFSSGPAAKTAHNVPVVLRAFAHIFDDDNDLSGRPRLPTGRRYVPYPPPRRQRRTPSRARQARRASESSHTSHASLLADLAHFFPARGPLILPPTPETLVSPGIESTLSLPLAPGLDSLLALPTPEVSYADAEVGSAVLSTLLPLGDAISLASARVLPLLARLENLRVLEDMSWPRTKLQVEMRDGRPDILRVVFESRSAEDVITLLGDIARDPAAGPGATPAWLAISERSVLPETEEQWERVPRRSAWEAPPAAPVGLIMPTLPDTTEEAEDIDVPSPMPSSPAPSSLLDSWGSDTADDSDDEASNASFLLELASVSSVSWMSPALSEAGEWSTSSLASDVMSAADMWDQQRGWAVPPSPEDVAVVSGGEREVQVRYERALLVGVW